jgi:hypothetical protein
MYFEQGLSRRSVYVAHLLLTQVRPSFSVARFEVRIRSLICILAACFTDVILTYNAHFDLHFRLQL